MGDTWPFRMILAAACALTVAAAGAAALPVSAEEGDYSFHVSYRAYLSGIRVGTGHLAGKFEGTDYRVVANGEVSGFARLFSSYRGSSQARGSLRHGASSFRAESEGDGKHQTIRMRLNGGRVRQIDIQPAPKPHRVNHPDRVQITDDHKRKVTDPLSALVVPNGYDGAGFNRAACERVVPVFSGEARFDMALRFREIRNVSAAHSDGYSGPVMVCDASYNPVAGHRTDHSTVRYLRQAEIEVMFAPMPGTDVLVPYRVSVSTPLGPAVLQSQRFTGTGRFAAFAGSAD